MSGGLTPNFSRIASRIANRFCAGHQSGPRACRGRIAPDLYRGSRSRLCRPSCPSRRDVPLKRVRHRLRARSSARRQHPSPRASPRADEIGRATPAQCRRWFCSPPKADCGTTRSRDRWRHRDMWALFVFNYLENGLQYTDNRAVRPIFAFSKTAQPVKVTEQFVSAVDEMNDHFGSMCARKARPLMWLIVAAPQRSADDYPEIWAKFAKFRRDVRESNIKCFDTSLRLSYRPCIGRII